MAAKSSKGATLCGEQTCSIENNLDILYFKRPADLARYTQSTL